VGPSLFVGKGEKKADCAEVRNERGAMYQSFLELPISRRLQKKSTSKLSVAGEGNTLIERKDARGVRAEFTCSI